MDGWIKSLGPCAIGGAIAGSLVGLVVAIYTEARTADGIGLIMAVCALIAALLGWILCSLRGAKSNVDPPQQ